MSLIFSRVCWRLLLAAGLLTLSFAVTAEPNCRPKAPATGEGLDCSPGHRAVAARWQAQQYKDDKDLAIQLREQLIRTHSLWRQSKRIHELYQRKLLPLADEHLETTSQAYQFGSHGFLALLIAQRQALVNERKAKAVSLSQSTALAELTAAASLAWLGEWQVPQTKYPSATIEPRE